MNYTYQVCNILKLSSEKETMSRTRNIHVVFEVLKWNSFVEDAAIWAFVFNIDGNVRQKFISQNKLLYADMLSSMGK